MLKICHVLAPLLDYPTCGGRACIFVINWLIDWLPHLFIGQIAGHHSWASHYSDVDCFLLSINIAIKRFQRYPSKHFLLERCSIVLHWILLNKWENECIHGSFLNDEKLLFLDSKANNGFFNYQLFIMEQGHDQKPQFFLVPTDFNNFLK